MSYYTNGVKPEDGSDPVEVLEQPLHTARKLKVICIGAGFAGLTAAYKYKHEFKMQEHMDLTIYEKNPDVGGTWYENRYPGAACDVPAPIYTFSFEPNPDCSQFYSSGPEIWEYTRRTTTKYGLDEYVKFNCKILEANWDDHAGKWKIKLRRGDDEVEDEADVLINSTGFLNQWKWPDIAGLHDFKGDLLRSAHWDQSVSYDGKRVAIIGNGSSGIQILPQMQKTANQITTYIRTPTWIATNFASQFTKDGGNFTYSEEEKEEFRKNPEKLRQYRHDIEHAVNSYFFGFLKDSEAQGMFRGMLEGLMKDRLKDSPELASKIIPNWHVGCRRLTPGDGYLEALQASNVRVEFDGIDKVTTTGIRTQTGKEEEFDVIVCATGFDVSFSPPWKITGKDGKSVQEMWKETPEAYFGVNVPYMPNYFVFTGPNTPLGHGNIFPVFDAVASYVWKWCKKISENGIKSVMPSAEATREYNNYTQQLLGRTVWSSGCRSWYKNGTVDGRVTAMYGGSMLHYKHFLEQFRTEDFEYEYLHKNRFCFMGNGLTSVDIKGEDLAYYL